LLEGMVTGKARDLPVNLPNTGQVTNLPDGVMVECIGTSDADGVRARDVTTIPGVLGSRVAQIVASQELTVDAALSGDRSTLLEAMCSDPVVGSLAWEDIVAMTNDLLLATSRWLPRFAGAVSS
jgi:alpha-galactosidase/6-phospho-beta-glucosidase family protein